MPIDISRETTGVVLPAAVTNRIWDKVESEASLVMRLGTRVDVPAGGSITPTITAMPKPSWVGETDKKPVRRPTVGSVAVQPYKTALIVPFSNEFRRDLPGLYNALARKLPAAISDFIDETVLFGPSPGTGFSTLAAATTVDVSDPETSYADYLGALGTVAAAGGDIDAWVLSTQAEMLALGATDGNNRPLWGPANNAPAGVVGNILGRPVVRSKKVYYNPTEAGTDVTASTVGFAGDWSSLQYGFVEGITVRFSDQATIEEDDGDLINLWQRNMFALLVEAEVGVAIYEPNHFVRLTGAVEA